MLCEVLHGGQATPSNTHVSLDDDAHAYAVGALFFRRRGSSSSKTFMQSPGPKRH